MRHVADERRSSRWRTAVSTGDRAGGRSGDERPARHAGQRGRILRRDGLPPSRDPPPRPDGDHRRDERDAASGRLFDQHQDAARLLVRAVRRPGAVRGPVVRPADPPRDPRDHFVPAILEKLRSAARGGRRHAVQREPPRRPASQRRLPASLRSSSTAGRSRTRCRWPITWTWAAGRRAASASIASSIQEGLIIPPVRIMHRGVIDPSVLSTHRGQRPLAARDGRRPAGPAGQRLGGPAPVRGAHRRSAGSRPVERGIDDLLEYTRRRSMAAHRRAAARARSRRPTISTTTA